MHTRLPASLHTPYCALAAALLITLLLTGHASALSRMGAVEVTDHAGTPCFGLPKQERKRIGQLPEVFGLDVYDGLARPIQRLWSFEFAYPASLPLPPGACVVYGQAPTATRTQHPSAPLQAGRMYEVMLSASKTGPTQGHMARFCLKDIGDGNRRAIQIRYHATLGWSPAICLP